MTMQKNVNKNTETEIYKIGLEKIVSPNILYFKSKHIIDDVFKELFKECNFERREMLRKSIQHRLVILLIILKNCGYIAKYNRVVWKKIKSFPENDLKFNSEILYRCQNCRKFSINK